MIRYNVRYFSIAVFLLIVNCIHAQVLSFDHGEIEFYTSSILSDIEATSDNAQVTLNLETGEVLLKIAIETFEFEYEMMQEHFNEEYMESDKFPEATFKGKINQGLSKYTDLMEVDVSGTLTIHGVSKKTAFKATIAKNEGFTVVKCKFPIVFKDFNVEEPSILTKSVAKDVELKSTLYLK